jgi:hypothetical protein
VALKQRRPQAAALVGVGQRRGESTDRIERKTAIGEQADIGRIERLLNTHHEWREKMHGHTKKYGFK